MKGPPSRPFLAGLPPADLEKLVDVTSCFVDQNHLERISTYTLKSSNCAALKTNGGLWWERLRPQLRWQKCITAGARERAAVTTTKHQGFQGPSTTTRSSPTCDRVLQKHECLCRYVCGCQISSRPFLCFL